MPFNLHPRYLQPFTLVEEAPSWDHALQYLLSNGLLRFRIPVLFAISGISLPCAMLAASRTSLA